MEYHYKKLIVFEGGDGTGKSTQAKKLVEWLNYNGNKAVYIHFPSYEDPTGKAIKDMLHSNMDAEDINLYGASVMYTADRFYSITFGSYAKYFQDPELIIVADRWVGSNMIHQAAKMIKDQEAEDFIEEMNQDGLDAALLSFNLDMSDEMYSYMNHYCFNEYNNMGIPLPDKQFYIELPIDEQLKRLDQRAKSGEELDIHEEAMFVKKSYISGRSFADCRATIIDGTGTEDEVFKRIVDALNIRD